MTASGRTRRRVPLPDDDALTRGLSSVLAGRRSAGIRILTRTTNAYASWYDSEVVECVRADRTKLRILVKYGPSSDREGGQRLGPGYEALVYRHVLEPLSLPSPRCYGSCTARRGRDTWLMVEHITGGLHANTTRIQEKGMNAAADWIGRFHARNQSRASRFDGLLNRYDSRYCRHWMRRTLRFEADSAATWLKPLGRRFHEAIAVLTAAPQTVIHGDFYGDNALYRRGLIFPIDWERTGVGAGEIDMACLTQGWPDAMADRYLTTYCRARWPRGAPRQFGRRFNAAQLYVLFRLLGEAPGWPEPETRAWRLDLLRAAGERMGLIPAQATVTVAR